MRKCLTGLVMLSLVFVEVPASAQAGVFATEVTQLLNHAQLVMAYIRQGVQLQNEIRMYADMVRNAQQLPSQVFGPINTDLNALASIVQGGQALAYSLANLDAQFRNTFHGYATNPNTYYRQYRNWSQTSLDTTLGALRAAGLQGRQLQSEQSVLNSLRSMASHSNGRMEALQVMGQIADQQVQQLMKLRELMLADMSSKQAYQAAVIQQQSAKVAATQWYFSAGPATSDGRGFWPGMR